MSVSRTATRSHEAKRRRPRRLYSRVAGRGRLGEPAGCVLDPVANRPSSARVPATTAGFDVGVTAVLVLRRHLFGKGNGDFGRAVDSGGGRPVEDRGRGLLAPFHDPDPDNDQDSQENCREHVSLHPRLLAHGVEKTY